MNKINTALCAYGMSGKVFHGPFLKCHAGFEVTKILERTKSLSQEDFPEATIVRDFHDILDDASIELVVINTPPAFHYDMAKRALLAGKHVVVEKPFVCEVKHGEELIAIAKQQNLVLSVFHNRRWDSPFLAAKALIEQQSLGRIVEFEANFDRFRTGLSAKAWKESEAPGTGLLYDLGSHLIDQAIQLFGQPIEVYANMQKQREGSKVVDYVEVQLQFETVKANLKARMMVNAPTPVIALYGDKGSYQNFCTDKQEEQLVAGVLPNTKNWGTVNTEDYGKLYLGDQTTAFPSPKGNWPHYYENIYQAIRNDEPLLVKPEEALEVIRLIDACLESFRGKKVVTL